MARSLGAQPSWRLGRTGCMYRSLANALQAAWQLVLPDSCAACQAPLTHARTLFCPECSSRAPLCLAEHTLGELTVWTIASYAGPVQEAITRFKFGHQPQLARRFAREFALHWPPAASLSTLRSALLVPVPLHPRRLVERGYNQSALLARELGKSAGLATSLRGLQRVVYTAQQSQLSRDARLSNLQGAFAARAPLARKSVVLVDDVATTGATLAACARAALSAGAKVLGALSIAHTE